LIREVCAIDAVERVGFVNSHPKDNTEETRPDPSRIVQAVMHEVQRPALIDRGGLGRWLTAPERDAPLRALASLEIRRAVDAGTRACGLQ
jgi:hypothetical protein